MIGYVAMEDFMTYYINYNKLTSIDAFKMRETFSKFLSGYFSEDNMTPETVNAILYEINYEDWIYGVGTDPSGTLDFNTDQSNAAVNLAN